MQLEGNNEGMTNHICCSTQISTCDTSGIWARMIFVRAVNVDSAGLAVHLVRLPAPSFATNSSYTISTATQASHISGICICCGKQRGRSRIVVGS